jgi:hypothetical protein
MHSTEPVISSKRLGGGRVMSGFPALFLLVDGAVKLFKPPAVFKATMQLGYPESVIVGLGLVLLASTVCSTSPRARQSSAPSC